MGSARPWRISVKPAHARQRFRHAAGPRVPVVPRIDLFRDGKLDPIFRGVAASVALGGFSAVSLAVAPASAAPAVTPRAAAVITPASMPPDAPQSSTSSLNGEPIASAVTLLASMLVEGLPSPQSSVPTPATPSTSGTTLAPVAGLSQIEMDNAVAIVTAGKQMNLPSRAFVVAIATALQESHLRNLANPNVPGSMSHPNDGVGYDYDSVGLFQQRPNWGTVDQLMDPQESARRFYTALMQIPGWAQMAVTYAAQAVQRSAFPGAYAQHQSLAERIVAAIG
jgi:hypothetical protein